MLSVGGLSFNVMEKCSFDPATLPLTLWVRDYTGIAPWNSLISTGTSGSNSLATSGSDPTLGVPVNGRNTASMTGAATKLNANGTLGTYINAASFSGWIVFNSINGTSNLDMLIDSNSVFNPYCSSSSNVRFILGTTDIVNIGYSINTWYWFSFRYDGTTLGIGLNNIPGTPVPGFTTTTTVANPSTTGTLTLGSSASFQGRIAEIAISNQIISDTDFLKIKGYAGWRYGLPL